MSHCSFALEILYMFALAFFTATFSAEWPSPEVFPVYI
jgi:hypothetical protein